jgi:alkanesulfonate monooxygenase SsuD/methylene tetrahydromethanopterin reductase-like flavin-dependent oxidoreductase (luciferase family)
MGAGGRENPIPVEPVLRRIGRLADGWFPICAPDDKAREVIDRIHGYAREAGRDPSAIGMEARINITDGPDELWAQQARAWEGLAATHISVNTMRAGLKGPDQHIEAIRRFREAVRA